MMPPHNDVAHSLSEKLAKPTTRRKNIISLTPLIDVVFILLVFFMLASSFLDWQTINLDTAPKASTMVDETQPIRIAVKNDELFLNGKAMSLDRLIEQLKTRQPSEQSVSLQPLEQTPTQALVNVLEALNQAGIKPLSLIDDPEWVPEPVSNPLPPQENLR
ncbi:MAG: biopolymer transporter ExbD [Pseudomonadota bacterium]